MTQLALPSDGSPFDAIKHVDEQGEYWLARDLQPLMQYAQWRDFAVVVEKAKASLALVEGKGSATSNFVEVRKINNGRPGRAGADYHLTRFAAYLTAMAGDDTKEAVAQARVYFAVKSREAEARTELDELEVARRYVKAIEDKRALEAVNAEQAQRLAIAEPKADYVTGFVDAEEDASILRVFANQVGTTDPKLRDYLKQRKVLSRRTVERRWSTSKGRMEPVYEWLPYAAYRTWFVPKDQPEAPRLHNGQMRTTLYVTPVGKVGIRRLLMKHPIGSEAA
jgi:DNA-damage-inducible protein D